MSKKVLILGNGFDLNLGRNTKYSDFAKTVETLPGTGNSLGAFLNKRKTIDNWYDLESALRDFATSPDRRIVNRGNKTQEQDKELYKVIVNRLVEYLKLEEEKEIDKDSLAADCLRHVVDNGYFDSIYTFNYTSLGEVLKTLGLNTCKYRYVHGSLEHNSAILGIETPLKEIQGECYYMLKTFNEHYESNPIQYDLQDADEVVILGHAQKSVDVLTKISGSGIGRTA